VRSVHQERQDCTSVESQGESRGSKSKWNKSRQDNIDSGGTGSYCLWHSWVFILEASLLSKIQKLHRECCLLFAGGKRRRVSKCLCVLSALIVLKAGRCLRETQCFQTQMNERHWLATYVRIYINDSAGPALVALSFGLCFRSLPQVSSCLFVTPHVQ
jgi:hypothetical protein